MIAASAAAILVCAIPLPLNPGQKPEDRDIAMVRAPLPAAMVTSLQGPAPLSTQRFAGEDSAGHEWVIATPPTAEGASKMLRLTPQVNVGNPYKVRLGDASRSAKGAWTFKQTGEGACRIEAAQEMNRNSAQ